ncbi:MAG: hypothetical protein LQ344_008102 [Seirophora lacunosa]|nr:MAG: hypothetical protein LQ344_008102 [Seirophora lacunosa]
MFRFCELSLSQHPSYARVLASLRDKDHPSKLLDLGCCFGQDIRKLVHDAATPENLIACDLNRQFLDLSYDIFQDRATLKTPMLAADLFQPDGPLKEMEATVDIVHASLLLHLFSWDKQKEACKRIVK